MDFYQILEISKRASEEDIRRAFRKLARQYHPDVSSDPDAQDRFRLVYMAYDILHDRKKRLLYDELQVMKEAEERFAHEADIRAWQKHAVRNASAYAEMSYQEFHETFFSRLQFHSSQVFAFIMFFVFLCVGSSGIMVGLRYLVYGNFEGHTILGYLLIAFGTGFAFTASKAIWDIMLTWRK